MIVIEPGIGFRKFCDRSCLPHCLAEVTWNERYHSKTFIRDPLKIMQVNSKCQRSPYQQSEHSMLKTNSLGCATEKSESLLVQTQCREYERP